MYRKTRDASSTDAGISGQRQEIPTISNSSGSSFVSHLKDNDLAATPYISTPALSSTSNLEDSSDEEFH
jgi:hypothetical protein